MTSTDASVPDNLRAAHAAELGRNAYDLRQRHGTRMPIAESMLEAASLRFHPLVSAWLSRQKPSADALHRTAMATLESTGIAEDEARSLLRRPQVAAQLERMQTMPWGTLFEQHLEIDGRQIGMDRGIKAGLLENGGADFSQLIRHSVGQSSIPRNIPEHERGILRADGSRALAPADRAALLGTLNTLELLMPELQKNGMIDAAARENYESLRQELATSPFSSARFSELSAQLRQALPIAAISAAMHEGRISKTEGEGLYRTLHLRLPQHEADFNQVHRQAIADKGRTEAELLEPRPAPDFWHTLPFEGKVRPHNRWDQHARHDGNNPVSEASRMNVADVAEHDAPARTPAGRDNAAVGQPVHTRMG